MECKTVKISIIYDDLPNQYNCSQTPATFLYNFTTDYSIYMKMPRNQISQHNLKRTTKFGLTLPDFYYVLQNFSSQYSMVLQMDKHVDKLDVIKVENKFLFYGQLILEKVTKTTKWGNNTYNKCYWDKSIFTCKTMIVEPYLKHMQKSTQDDYRPKYES